MSSQIVTRSPGRVNLIGDHTDYTGGLVLPMAINRYTTITATPQQGLIDLVSADEPEPVHLLLPIDDPASVHPVWGKYVAGVAGQLGATAQGIKGTVVCDIPIGSGLSSSAALELAAALALGSHHSQRDLAQLCQRAEHLATGVPCGIMDQLSCTAGKRNAALLIDCHTLDVTPVQLPNDIQVYVQFIAMRTLSGSHYASRVTQCAAAELVIGPLRLANVAMLDALDDLVVKARARHVITENQRVRDAVACLRSGNIAGLGELMFESHNSLQDNLETSTPQMNRAVEVARKIPGVHGARMTGGGFGGSIVIVADAKTDLTALGEHCLAVRAVDGAQRVA